VDGAAECGRQSMHTRSQWKNNGASDGHSRLSTSCFTDDDDGTEEKNVSQEVRSGRGRDTSERWVCRLSNVIIRCTDGTDTSKERRAEPLFSHETISHRLSKQLRKEGNLHARNSFGETTCLNKSCDTVHSLTSLTNVDRFSKFFHCRVFREICNKIYVIYLATL